jgi:hypothetical protein
VSKSEIVEEGCVRPPAVAGTFYPGTTAALGRTVTSLLEQAETQLEAPPKALIAPHAGYRYSGAIAASALVHWSAASNIERVVLVGPSHHFAFEGMALSQNAGFATPLGVVPVDVGAVEQIARLPRVRLWEPAHELEHSLEVELPFLQQALGQFEVVPILTGTATAREVGQVLESLWGGPETVFVISSDLSHYHDYETACALDRRTAARVETLTEDELGPEDACGCVAVNGLLWLARRHRLNGELLDLRNSGDTAGPRSRVVGYGAFAFS